MFGIVHTLVHKMEYFRPEELWLNSKLIFASGKKKITEAFLFCFAKMINFFVLFALHDPKNMLLIIICGSSRSRMFSK